MGRPVPENSDLVDEIDHRDRFMQLQNIFDHVSLFFAMRHTEFIPPLGTTELR